jgi:hypothetical protein
MRIDLRLLGRTASGKVCVMETSVYASSQNQFMQEAKMLSTEGPWYFKETGEPVLETEEITVESVRRLEGRRASRNAPRQ